MLEPLVLAYTGKPQKDVPAPPPADATALEATATRRNADEWEELFNARVVEVPAARGPGPASASGPESGHGPVEEPEPEAAAPPHDADGFDWQAFYREKRTKARSWVGSNPLARLVAMTEVAKILLRLMSTYLQYGSSWWQKKQEARAGRGETRTVDSVDFRFRFF